MTAPERETAADRRKPAARQEVREGDIPPASSLLPYPLLMVGLVLMWLLLNRFSLGHLILGCLIAIVAVHAMSALEPAKPQIRNWSKLLVLGWRMTLDILRSNLLVARLVLFGRAKDSEPVFIEIPLKLRDPTALAMLAVTLTATPGTAWIHHDAASGVLLLHVLDRREGDDWVRVVKQRYETLLLEIFE